MLVVFMNCAPEWPVLFEDLHGACSMCVGGVHFCKRTVSMGGAGVYVAMSWGRCDSLTQQRGAGLQLPI